LVLANFDSDYDAGEGAVAISVSRRRLVELKEEGVPASVIDRAARIVLVLAADGAIITAINRPNWFARFHHGAERLGHRHRARQRSRSRH
jgi:hypothetical protein